MEDSVFWLDWGPDGALREMCGSPLAVDRPFADYLEGVLGSAVFTSATLSQNGSFALLRDRLGMRFLASKPRELVIPSPFPFDENCLVLVVSGLGDPNHDGFAAPVAELVAGLAAGVGRRTMVLFTSYRLCRSVAEALARNGVERPVLVQGAGESREALSGKLRKHEGGVLLGVASFWEGVDFPGEELEVLVIPKIPFPVPAEPIVEARSQRFSSLGEDPFEKLFLPEAILRMRQGSGRLIRRMNDRGVIVILDSRLGTRPYGGTILSSLPSRNIEHVTVEECVGRVARWFAGT
ncbi:MAG: ATP-dependent DNA helicase [Candidatus Krumholzibacteriia bacterium]